MAVTPLTIVAERWLDEVILYATVANNAGGTISEDFGVPAGLGDIAILSLSCTVFSITTAPTVPETPRGMFGSVVSSTGQLVEHIGAARWYWISGTTTALTRAAATLDPDALVLMRQSEFIRILSPELDVDAAPTGDFEIIVKAVRVKPVESAPGPIRLVR